MSFLDELKFVLASDQKLPSIRKGTEYHQLAPYYKTREVINQVNDKGKQIYPNAGFYCPPGIIWLDCDDPIKTKILYQIINKYCPKLPPIQHTTRGMHFGFRLPIIEQPYDFNLDYLNISEEQLKALLFFPNHYPNWVKAKLPFGIEVDIRCGAWDLKENPQQYQPALYKNRMSFIITKFKGEWRQWENMVDTFEEFPELPYWLIPQHPKWGQDWDFNEGERNQNLNKLGGAISNLQDLNNQPLYNREQVEFIRDIVNEFLIPDPLPKDELKRLTFYYSQKGYESNRWVALCYTKTATGSKDKLLNGKFAKEMIRRYYIHRHNHKLIYWNSLLLKWMIEDGYLLGSVIDKLLSEISPTGRSNILNKIAFSPDVKVLPEIIQHRYINFKNLTFDSWTGQPIIGVKSPQYFTVFEYDVDYTNKWHNNPPIIKVNNHDRTIESIIRDDWANKKLLRYQHMKQQLVNILMPHTKSNQGIFNLGDTHNGKTLYYESLVHPIVGYRHLLATPLEYLDNPFILAESIYKALIYSDESESKNFQETGVFKTLTSGGVFKSEEKGKAAKLGRSVATIVVNFNTFPNIKKEKATRQRIDLTQWEGSFIGNKRDSNLKHEILSHSECLEWWVYECLSTEWEILNNNKWQYTWNENDVLTEILDEKDNFKIWLKDLDIDHLNETYLEELKGWKIKELKDWFKLMSANLIFTIYQSYCNISGFKPVGRQTFYENVRNEFNFEKDFKLAKDKNRKSIKVFEEKGEK